MSLQPNKEPTGQEPIPDILVDPGTKRRYQRGKFLGKGGFAKCYELVDMDTRTIYAGKIVSKGLLTKQHQKDKMAQEISIHRVLLHAHIVGFHSFFEDKNFVYIVLELCSKRSLMELHKRRKALTEPEARYFLRHILLGVQFLHNQKIIHRDLKLGNLFLNDNMEVKVGDFGLATRVEFDGERKRTLCGTPNYIAPEVLNKKGHSYEVDIWSIGCILYTLLVGRPPFETQTLKDTYSRIKKNEYTVPSRVGPSAKNIIVKMLQSEPARRPNVEQVLHDEFMTGGYLPSRLPLSCLTTSPRFDTKNNVSLVAGTTRKPLVDLNAKEGNPQMALKKEVGLKNPADGPKDAASTGSSNSNNLLAEPDKMFQYYLKDLERQLRSFLVNPPQAQAGALANMDEAEDPAAVPMVWVSKWVDYSDKYGFGYQLCDDSIGVIFNDMTKLLLLTDGKNIHYIERGGSEQYYTLQSYPGTLEKKVKLLSYFRHYMNEHLLKAGASITPREGDELSRIPCVRQWFRTSRAVVMHFSNGTLQINFFNDHTKIVLCPLMGAVTYIDMEKNFRTYRLSLLQEHGCSEELATRLRYALEKVTFLLSCKSGGSMRPKLLS